MRTPDTPVVPVDSYSRVSGSPILFVSRLCRSRTVSVVVWDQWSDGERGVNLLYVLISVSPLHLLVSVVCVCVRVCTFV